MLKVEKNIPIPAVKFGRPYKYPFPSMQVGDSFLVKPHQRPRYFRHVMEQCAKRHKVRVIMRNLANGTRVWRVK